MTQQYTYSKKQKLILVTVVLLILTSSILSIMQPNNTTINSSFSTGTSQTLYATANTLIITDMDQFAADFMVDYVQNSFRSMIFNFDNGYPGTLTVYVYSSVWQELLQIDPTCITITNINTDTPVIDIQ